MVIAGLVIQVVVIGICILLADNFAFNVVKGKVVSHRPQKQSAESPQCEIRNIRLYLFCIILAFTTIFIRSIYRVPEFADGWGSGLMRNELDFMLLDGMVVAIATTAMVVGHPGIYFPAMSSKKRKQMQMLQQQHKQQGDENHRMMQVEGV